MRVENGDILLLIGSSLKESLYGTIASKRYTHVCMLFRDSDHITGKDTVYILESGVGMSVKEGIRVVEFQYYLDRWKGSGRVLFGRFLSSSNPKTPFSRPSTQDILQVANNNLHVKFDRSFLSYFFPNFTDTPRDSMFCSEAIVFILQRLNLASKSIVPWSLSPDDICSYSSCIDTKWFFEEIDIGQIH